jgi:hypothetical protein
MRRFSVLLLLTFPSVCFAQADSADTIELLNKRVMSGVVLSIKTGSIGFKDARTDSLFEFQKKEIKEVRLHDGKVLTFEGFDEADKNSGPDIGGYFLIAFSVLLLIGTIIQASSL